MENPYLSQRLIDELKANKIIRQDVDVAKTQLIIRKFLIDAYKIGITDERCARNKKEYTSPIPDNL